MEASIGESSSPLESGGQANRPSAIETILNAGKGKANKGANPVDDDDDDDDDYEDDDYDDDEWWKISKSTMN